MLLGMYSSFCLSPLDNVIHFSPVRRGPNCSFLLLSLSLWRKPVKDALLDSRMTACFYPVQISWSFDRACSKGTALSNNVRKPSLLFYQKGVLALCLQRTTNFPFFYPQLSDNGERSGATGLFQGQEKKLYAAL